MRRLILLCLAPVFAALLTFAVPEKAAAQYGGYPNPPRYAPYQQPMPGVPDVRDLGGPWYKSGREDQPCQVIPSRLDGRAHFINENGDGADGYLRGNLIIVPRWGNVQGRFLGDMIRWSNGTVWTR